MPKKPLSERADFEAMTTSDIAQPKYLPKEYRWLRKGSYAVYRGDVTDNGRREPANWGWEVNQVNGPGAVHGEFSSLSYTLYLESESESIHNWLDFPTLWSSFFLPQTLGHETIPTPWGPKDCFKQERRGSMFAPVQKEAWYDKESFILIKLDVSAMGQHIYTGLLSDTNVFS